MAGTEVGVVLGREPSDRVLRGLLAAAPDALIAVSAEGEIVFVNDRAETIFGWPRAELVGRQVAVLVPERFRDRHPLLGTDTVALPTTGRTRSGVELWARRRDGTEFPAEVSLSGFETGEATFVVAAIRDVSDRIEPAAERQRRAIEAEREWSHRLESLGELAGGVAHDFNNLLGVILNYSTLLARRVHDPALAADVAEINAAAERATALTRQLLTFARRGVAHREAFDVSQAVRRVASTLEETLGEHIEVRLDLAPGPVVAVADRHQVEQMILNLAMNARDAMPDGGHLAIATMASDDGSRPEAVLRVTDTGAGMPPEVVARAFEPFFTTKPRGQGTGLGLAMVYGIVRQNDGDVRISSVVGTGTTVTVVLPGAAGAAGAVAAAEPTVDACGGGYERILLVEDEKALRAATARILVAHGYDVLVASDGMEALEIFEDEGDRIDVVVTDVVMPRMKGDELSRRLVERRPEVAVIFMSGYDFSAAPLNGRLLTKPVDEETLLRAVREAIDE